MQYGLGLRHWQGRIEMEIDFSQEHQTLKAREEEFRGKHVLVIGEEIHEIKDDEQGVRLNGGQSWKQWPF